ncbi:MAG: hypothetical protein PVF54_03110 [Anaerolineae bacterium]|jgi:hypothetical protein
MGRLIAETGWENPRTLRDLGSSVPTEGAELNGGVSLVCGRARGSRSVADALQIDAGATVREVDGDGRGAWSGSGQDS